GRLATIEKGGKSRPLSPVGQPQLPEKRRAASSQRVQIDAFIVAFSSLPTPVKDAYPFECQRPHRSLVGTAFGTLLPIVGAGPERFVDRLGGPFDKSLAQESWTLPAPMHPAFLA